MGTVTGGSTGGESTKAEEIGQAIAEGIDALEGRIPVATAWMSAKGLPPQLQKTGTRIPSFAFPEQAAIAMARAAAYGRWREKPMGSVRMFDDARPDEAYAILATALGRRDDGWLTPDEVDRLLACYGLRTAPSERAATPEEAGEVAAKMGGSVAVKAIGPDIVHKSEIGGVALGLSGTGEVAHSAREISERMTAASISIEGFFVQEMVEGGVEMLVGVAHDLLFGPVVAVGAGGTIVELLKDVAVRITPISDLGAHEMVRALGTFPLLDGFRGAPKADCSRARGGHPADRLARRASSVGR